MQVLRPAPTGKPVHVGNKNLKNNFVRILLQIGNVLLHGKPLLSVLKGTFHKQCLPCRCLQTVPKANVDFLLISFIVYPPIYLAAPVFISACYAYILYKNRGCTEGCKSAHSDLDIVGHRFYILDHFEEVSRNRKGFYGSSLFSVFYYKS